MADSSLADEVDSPDMHLVPITTDDLLGASTDFARLGKGDMFYDMALRLLQAGFEIEAYVLFLATWNHMRFQRAKDSDVDCLRTTLSKLQHDFVELEPYTIQSIDLTNHRERMAGMFDALKLITGVESTGATKVMHLKLPALFVMWDTPIRGGEDAKYYQDLPCVANRKWRFRKFEPTGECYVKFLADVQGRLRDLRYPTRPRTLAKTIDEFHYLNITDLIQKEKDKEKAGNKAKKKTEEKAKREADMKSRQQAKK
jgi:hypothetical protein